LIRNDQIPVWIVRYRRAAEGRPLRNSAIELPSVVKVIVTDAVSRLLEPLPEVHGIEVTALAASTAAPLAVNCWIACL
jgi:hypothetical protein